MRVDQSTEHNDATAVSTAQYKHHDFYASYKRTFILEYYVAGAVAQHIWCRIGDAQDAGSRPGFAPICGGFDSLPGR